MKYITPLFLSLLIIAPSCINAMDVAKKKGKLYSCSCVTENNGDRMHIFSGGTDSGAIECFARNKKTGSIKKYTPVYGAFFYLKSVKNNTGNPYHTRFISKNIYDAVVLPHKIKETIVTIWGKK